MASRPLLVCCFLLMLQNNDWVAGFDHHTLGFQCSVFGCEVSGVREEKVWAPCSEHYLFIYREPSNLPRASDLGIDLATTIVIHNQRYSR